MSKASLRRALLLGMPLVLGLTACNYRSIAAPDLGDTHPEIEQVQALEPYSHAFYTDHPCPNIFKPPCSYGMAACDPSSYEIISDLAPTFSWGYDCNPDGYRFSLRQIDYDDNHIIFADDLSTYDPALHGPARSFNWPDSLQPATHYRWVISAFQSDIFPAGFDQVTSNDFWTGPICEDAESLVAPSLGDPGNGWALYTSESSLLVKLHWAYGPASVSCLPPYFLGQVADDAAFTSNVTLIENGPGLADWGESVLARCRTYYWRVQGMVLGEGGPWSEVHSFRILPYSGPKGCLIARAVIARARVNAACRLGPGTAYGTLAYVPAGEGHPAEGRNADGTWIKLQDLRCYISRELVDLEEGTPFPGGPDVGDLLAILPDPPLPTVPPKVCKPTMGPAECPAAGGTWIAPVVSAKLPSRCDCP